MGAQELNSPLAGMTDLYGVELRRRLFVTTVLGKLARSCGYEQVEVPLVERATSFSEEIVGRSPWPEWDQRGCFYLSVPDYAGSYDTAPSSTEALLIPEGTISVSRWLGRLLAQDEHLAWPLKVFYETPCFRNELVDRVNALKRRQFTQFGLELLGANAGEADIEAIHLIAASLQELGIASDAIRVRVGDVTVFNRLAELSGLAATDTITVKESLDAIAECKAGKQPERRPQLVDSVDKMLQSSRIDERWAKVWLDLARSQYSMPVLETVRDELVAARLAKLRELVHVLGMLDVYVELDLCVVRSHEYYSGIAFEIDVVAGAEVSVEVGGGGRYDRLVGHFLPHSAVRSVPATGFAFGIERLVDLLRRLDLLGADRSAVGVIGLGDAASDVLLVPSPTPAGYLAAVRAAALEREAGRAVDIYLGAPHGWRQYAEARGIADTRPLVAED